MLAIRGGPARHSHGAPLDAGSGGSGILECEEMGFVRRVVDRDPESSRVPVGSTTRPCTAPQRKRGSGGGGRTNTVHAQTVGLRDCPGPDLRVPGTPCVHTSLICSAVTFTSHFDRVD